MSRCSLVLGVLAVLACVASAGNVFELKGLEFHKNGEPFQVMSGSMHYFRTHPDHWEDRVMKLKAMGLNTISTYIAWNVHEPERGQYNWTGYGDLPRFLEICKKHEMYVLFRPGPYICGEWEFGGFPYWILENDDIVIRTKNDRYYEEVQKWYSVLMPKIQPYLYSNGGTILMVQIENEYGSYPTCNQDYLTWLYNQTVTYTGKDIVIYTTDGGADYFLKCGYYHEAYATVDFGAGDPKGPFEVQRKYQKTGPNMNSEFYPGWLCHWGEKSPHTATDPIVSTMKMMLDMGASFNFYMALGGTNWGFYAGSNGGGNSIQADLTSYDYDAPLTEAGDITSKYLAIREALKAYHKEPLPEVPKNTTKAAYGTIKLTGSVSLFKSLATQGTSTTKADNPMDFEKLHLGFGYVLYSTPLTSSENKKLTIDSVRDRVLVYVGEEYKGLIERNGKGGTIDLGTAVGTLNLLVENIGRLNYGGDMTDRKGISGVKINGKAVTGYTMITLPMDIPEKLTYSQEILDSGPAFYRGSFVINGKPEDTWIETTGWAKGHVYVNGNNIGRYWSIGPQFALYVPKFILVEGVNNVAIFEQEKPSNSKTMASIDHDILL